MFSKGLFLACALALLSACDSSSSDKPQAPKTAATTPVTQPVQDPKVLAERYAGRALSVVDVSEVQLDGASTLSVSFSVPLDPEQNFAEKLHVVDAKTGKVDGAWELSDNLMELHLRHLATAQIDPHRRPWPACGQRCNVARRVHQPPRNPRPATHRRLCQPWHLAADPVGRRAAGHRAECRQS